MLLAIIMHTVFYLAAPFHAQKYLISMHNHENRPANSGYITHEISTRNFKKMGPVRTISVIFLHKSEKLD